MTPEIAAFLYNLVCAQTVNAGAPDFDEVVALLQRAKAELIEFANAEAP